MTGLNYTSELQKIFLEDRCCQCKQHYKGVFLSNCGHKYCFKCICKNVIKYLSIYNTTPKCPHENCLQPISNIDIYTIFSSELCYYTFDIQYYNFNRPANNYFKQDKIAKG